MISSVPAEVENASGAAAKRAVASRTAAGKNASVFMMPIVQRPPIFTKSDNKPRGPAACGVDFGGEFNENLDNVSDSRGEGSCVLDRSIPLRSCRFAVEYCVAADREPASAVGSVLRRVPQPGVRYGRRRPQWD